MDDDFGADADLVALADAAERSAAAPPSARPAPPRQPQPRARPPNSASAPDSASSTKVVQPTPRALPQRTGPSAIIVSTRQKGNPLLTHITALPWEYGDIVPDYVLGATACGLFLSLKYHRLHPEYVYSRIRALGHKYRLRVLLVTVDIDNHEEPLRELAKTSLVNELTLMLAWSAREAARYLESYKVLEHAAPAAIRGARPAAWAEQLVDFVTVPRGINKTDATSMVGTFGSLRAAIAAPLEDLNALQGWGQLKAKRWHDVVRQPFRREIARGKTTAGRTTEGFVSAGQVGATERSRRLGSLRPGQQSEDREPDNETAQSGALREGGSVPAHREREVDDYEPGFEEEEALRISSLGDAAPAQAPAAESATGKAPVVTKNKRPRPDEPGLDAGIAAALAKYRKE